MRQIWWEQQLQFRYSKAQFIRLWLLEEWWSNSFDHRGADYANFSPISIDVADKATIWNSVTRNWPSRCYWPPLIHHQHATKTHRGSRKRSRKWWPDRGGHWVAQITATGKHVSSIRHWDIIRFDPWMPFGTSRWARMS